MFNIVIKKVFEILIFKHAKNKSIRILITHYINYIVVSSMSFSDFEYWILIFKILLKSCGRSFQQSIIYKLNRVVCEFILVLRHLIKIKIVCEILILKSVIQCQLGFLKTEDFDLDF